MRVDGEMEERLTPYTLVVHFPSRFVGKTINELPFSPGCLYTFPKIFFSSLKCSQDVESSTLDYIFAPVT